MGRQRWEGRGGKAEVGRQRWEGRGVKAEVGRQRWEGRGESQDGRHIIKLSDA